MSYQTLFRNIDAFEIDAASVARLLRTHEPTRLQVFSPPSAATSLAPLSVEQVLRLLVALEEQVDTAVIDAPLELVDQASLQQFCDALLLVTTNRLPSIKNTLIARDLLDRHPSLALVTNEPAPGNEGADAGAIEEAVQLRVLEALPWDETIHEGAAARPANGLSKAKSGFTKRIDQLAEHLHEHSLVR